MQKRIIFAFVLFGVFCGLVQAQIRPVATVNLGLDFIDQTQAQELVFIPPFYNTYTSQINQNKFLGGIFLGIETPLFNSLFAEVGLSYYKNSSLRATGVVSQFGDPHYDNLAYQYSIASQRLYAEGKLLSKKYNLFHPFISSGVGQAYNKATNFHEFKLSSEAVPLDSGFPDQSRHAFSYFLGLGLENELTQHVRLGCSYRWVSLNQAYLGSSVFQDESTSSLHNKLNANELLIQLSYLG